MSVESLVQTIPLINPVKYLIRRPHEIYSYQMLFAFILSFCSYKRKLRMFQSCDTGNLFNILLIMFSQMLKYHENCVYLIYKIFIDNIINYWFNLLHILLLYIIIVIKKILLSSNNLPI